MSFNIHRSEFVQIVNNSRGHWLTLSTVGTRHPHVHVYDSMYPAVNTSVKAQIAAILHTQSPVIHLQVMNVQMQAGESDCGLFSIEFAT